MRDLEIHRGTDICVYRRQNMTEYGAGVCERFVNFTTKDNDSFIIRRTLQRSHTNVVFSNTKQTRVMSLGEFPCCCPHHRLALTNALCVWETSSLQRSSALAAFQNLAKESRSEIWSSTLTANIFSDDKSLWRVRRQEIHCKEDILYLEYKSHFWRMFIWQNMVTRTDISFWKTNHNKGIDSNRLNTYTLH